MKRFARLFRRPPAPDVTPANVTPLWKDLPTAPKVPFKLKLRWKIAAWVFGLTDKRISLLVIAGAVLGGLLIGAAALALVLGIIAATA